MSIKLDQVLREYTLTEHSTDTHKNFVFDCHAHEPGGQTTIFSRLIIDAHCSWKDTVLVMDDGKTVGSGEDPRPFYWRGSACILTQVFHPGHGFINRVYVKNSDSWLTLITPDSMNPGKNWAPFVQGDDLYIIHEYAPFRVLKAAFLSENDGFMVLETVAEHPIAGARSYDKYSMFRGGSNALQIGDRIVGFGHTNQRANKDPKTIIHRPFVFVYKPETSVTYYEFNYAFPDTYNIVDPTSLYREGDSLYLVTSETEYAWNVLPQQGRTARYALKLTGDTHEDSFGFGGRRLHRWTYDAASQKRRFLGAWRRS